MNQWFGALQEQKGCRPDEKTLMTGVLGAAALFGVASGASADTLSDVKAKGFLQCGVNTGLLGFASPNDKGEWSGFDVDYCRAVASAILVIRPR